MTPLPVLVILVVVGGGVVLLLALVLSLFSFLVLFLPLLSSPSSCGDPAPGVIRTSSRVFNIIQDILVSISSIPTGDILMCCKLY